MEPTNKITKEEFDLYCSEELPVKQHRALGVKIDERFVSIVKSMSTQFSWVDYANEGGDEDSPGHFSIQRYKDAIPFNGGIKIPEPYHSNRYIPTRWLWEDFQEEFKGIVEVHAKIAQEREEKERQARIEAKANRVTNFLKKHNLVVQKLYNGAGKPCNVAIVFNNPTISEDYVMKFLEKNLR